MWQSISWMLKMSRNKLPFVSPSSLEMIIFPVRDMITSGATICKRSFKHFFSKEPTVVKLTLITTVTSLRSEQTRHDEFGSFGISTTKISPRGFGFCVKKTWTFVNYCSYLFGATDFNIQNYTLQAHNAKNFSNFPSLSPSLFFETL